MLEICPRTGILFVSLMLYSLVVQTTCNVGDLSSIPGSGRVQSLGLEDPLEKEMATHSSILAWKIPGTEESMGLQRVRHN